MNDGIGSILGIIPARAGSKGVPRKNVRLVGDKPMVAWTWTAARAAPSISRLIVSTDDLEVEKLAKSAGIDVPFRRPSELAGDTVSAFAVVEHALSWLEHNEAYRPDYVFWLQPTSPLRTTADIETAVALASERNASAIVGVYPVNKHPYWMKKLLPDGSIENFMPLDREYNRRQDMPIVYAISGAVYLIRREVLLEQKTFFPKGALAYVMPAERSLDVDSLSDLHLIDLILRDKVSNEST